MAFRLRTETELDAIALTGARVWRVLQRAGAELEPGLLPSDLETRIRDWLFEEELASSMLEVVNPNSGATFPAACSISVNEVAAHGIPSTLALQAGDLVTLDLAASHHGWHADAAISVVVHSSKSHPNRALAKAARLITDAAIGGLTSNGLWSTAAHAARQAADRLGVMILPGFGGHGIGNTLHEQPQARFDAFPDSAHDFRLAPGAVFTVEPIVTWPVDGKPDRALEVQRDWAIRTASGKPAACEERTVAMTAAGAWVLTGPGLSGHAAGHPCTA